MNPLYYEFVRFVQDLNPGSDKNQVALALSKGWGRMKTGPAGRPAGGPVW